MDKNAIKKFAVWARRELIARVSQKAEQYGITEEHHGDAYAERIGELLLTRTEQNQRKNLIIRIEQEDYKQVMEEVAYTWFNRFIALRFMEVNNYLPTRIHVFTDEENAFKPQILTEAIHMEMDGLDMEKVYAFKEKNQTEELFKYLIITQCNALSSILPGMFQTISDYTELLFPDNLLREGSVIEQMIKLIPEEDWQDQVQIIGWLYQYYNTEPKDQVFANLKKNIKISKHDIPAATQLFTPDWIVRYMVENSLGRLWVEGHPDDDLKAGWKYYLEEVEQEPDVQAQLTKIRKEYASLKPEDIKCIDPCMGSGHILVYMFDVLVQIYQAYGYSTREAVQSIVENNLYGLDIDDRAAQLAYFAVMMKARQYDRRFFTRGIQPHVCAIHESTKMPEDAWDYFGAEKDIAQRVYMAFVDAKEYGSLIEPNVTLAELDALDARLMEMDRMADTGNLAVQALMGTVLNVMEPLMKQAQMLVLKYDVVVTNPPYMGNNSFNAQLSEYVKTRYNEVKTDLFAVFMIRCLQYTKGMAFLGMITQHSWMTLSSYEWLRGQINNTVLTSMAHIGSRGFDEISGEMVATTSFATRKVKLKEYKGSYQRLVEYAGECAKEEAFLSGQNLYCARQCDYEKIPGTPVAYWVSRNIAKAFASGCSITKYADTFQGIITGDNDKFLRMWTEVSAKRIPFHASNMTTVNLAEQYWIPYNKGGEFRKWYGVQDYVVYWKNGPDDKTRGKKGFSDYYLREYVAWSYTIANSIATRYYPAGFLWDVRGSGIMDKANMMYYLEGLISSKVVLKLFRVNNSTLSCQVENIMQLPIILDNPKKELVDSIVIMSNDISKEEWDSYEVSWDFTEHPFVRWSKGLWETTNISATMMHYYGCRPDASCPLELCFMLWQGECNKHFEQLKSNEIELNRIFIDIYELQDELTPEVEDKDVTVRRADLSRDIRSFISYAVGCMFGRYSLSKPGLAFAGGEWDPANYTSEFQPDKDGILPISDDDYFTDDIVGRFVRFVEVVFGKETLEENLAFIAKALGGSGTPRDVIRNYFLNDFYADHLKIYQKRPIYWLFDSGKKNGFKCLIYMHRYAPDTIARIRTDYVHEQQSRYRTAIADLEKRVASATTAERVKLTKQLTKISAQAEELRLYEEKIHHLADQMISIDLDDGVKVNYAKFDAVLAKIK